MQAKPMRVFLSYARADDEAFVKRLHADLAAQGFTVWFDRESLLSRNASVKLAARSRGRPGAPGSLPWAGGPGALLNALAAGART